jgi:SAM-dependent methyltransferase
MTADATTNEAERRRWNDDHWVTTWPRREQLTRTVTPYLMEAAALRAGERVVDIGSGAGIAALAAAEAVGPAGQVVGADISVPLVGYATSRAADLGVTGVRFCVCDAQQDGVEGAPFDAAISQFGVMFFEDPVAAFANIRSQVADGGRLAFACWQALARNPWFTGPAVAPFVAPPPPPGPGRSPTGPFAFADAERVLSILTSAGWRDGAVALHEVGARVEESAVVDESQLRFQGVAEADIPAAMAAARAHLAPLRSADGVIEAPLAFQIFTAAR